MAEINELKHASLAVTYDLAEEFDSERFIKMRLRVCHDGTNPNGSHFEVTDMEATEHTIKNIPILANVIYDDEDQPQFGGHDMVIEKHKVKDGEYKTIYKEVPIGVIPETNNYEITEYDGRNYVFVDAYIWRGYANYAEDIIERDKDVKLSMEISVNEFTYNANSKVYNITDYKYTGITFLNKDFGTGMKKALATTGMFSETDPTEQMLMIMQELNNVLATFNKKNTEEGGTTMDTINDVTVPAEDVTPTITNTEESEIQIDNPDVTNITDAETNVDTEEPTEYIRTYKISHDDIRCGLYALLGSKELEDGDCYYIEAVYDEYFDYSSYCENKLMRQKYSLTDNNVTFIEEPFQVYREVLTSDEKAALETMRNNYSVMETELSELREYKLTAEKNILNTQRNEIIEKWSEQLKDNEQFVALKENIENYSVEELDTKCKCIYADSKAVFNFSAKSSKDDSIVRLAVNYELPEAKDPYGGLFTEFTNK